MMQPQTLPISVNSAGPSPAAAASRGQSGNGAPENTQFGQTLSREIEQRQQARSQATPAPGPQQQAKPAQAQASRNESKGPAKSAETAPKQDRAEAGEAADTQAAAGSAPGAMAEADEAAASAVESAAVTPVTDMLALVASMAAPTPAPITRIESEVATTLPGGVTADPAAAVAALGSIAVTSSVPLTGAGALDTALDTSAMIAPVTGLHVTQDTMTQDATAKDSAPDTGGMFADALAQTAQVNRGQQGLQQAAQAGTSQQPDSAALAAINEHVTDPAAAAPSPVQETNFVSHVQAARLEQVQANPLAAGDRLPARVGTPAWDRQLGQKIVWMVAGADQSATLTLNPPDLGPVQVVLNVTNDQATVNFTSAQLEVRQALETAMPKLREMMGESGITLGSATVNAGMPEQQQQAQRGNDARNGNGGGNGRGPHDGASSEGNGPAAPVRRAALPGQVDTFA